MRFDGAVLPDLVETVALYRLLLVRSDELPDIAARWLASDVVDTESTPLLAGHDRHDPGHLERVLADVVAEADVAVPDEPVTVQQIAVDWICSTWRKTQDTRWAVTMLARLGETDPEFNLGLFIRFDDEWSGGWGRLDADLEQDAKTELERLLRGDDEASLPR